MENENKNDQNSLWPSASTSEEKPTHSIRLAGEGENIFNNEAHEPDLDENKETDDLEKSEDMPLDKKDIVVMSRSKMDLIKRLLNNIKDNSQQLDRLLVGAIIEDDKSIGLAQFMNMEQEGKESETSESIIEGVFNGQHMIGPDGKQYNVPANYASKSKMVEGDILKLTILPNGKFIYKQIGPINRIRIVGRLTRGSNAEYFVQSEDNRKWRILTASVTYFKGQLDDEVIILVPKAGESSWAAVENIVDKS